MRPCSLRNAHSQQRPCRALLRRTRYKKDRTEITKEIASFNMKPKLKSRKITGLNAPSQD
jgi:hypothetical protein